jgi:hypothetical protein
VHQLGFLFLTNCRYPALWTRGLGSNTITATEPF